jgi:YesN/AraC family two-component response regulator
LAHASSGEWNLIYRLSANRDCAAIPVVLYGGEEDNTQLKTGLTQIVFKPCNKNTLSDWIGEIGSVGDTHAAILVVDDDPQARDYYKKLLALSHPERRILLAENGSQALDILQTEVPALILLDLVMPEVDGFKVLERVRADARTQRVPVVIVSGKLLNYEDIQRLNYYKTVFYTKEIFSPDETIGFISQLDGKVKPLPQPTSMLIKQVLAFLHQNYPQPINRKNIADAVGVSANYLSQIFRQEITISPWDYLNRLRIQKSKKLLLETQNSVTWIATQVGFNDSAYFSRVFHKLTGQSPLEYRQSGK